MNLHSTVSAVLQRNGIGRLARLGLEQPVRDERSRPGELVDADIKKLGRVQATGKRVGFRVTRPADDDRRPPVRPRASALIRSYS